MALALGNTQETGVATRGGGVRAGYRLGTHAAAGQSPIAPVGRAASLPTGVFLQSFECT
jgi:hypothetical protein